jgi:hypothetical protein
MRQSRRLSWAASVLLLGILLTTGALAQGPPLPKPGPEHEVFKSDLGTWDATVDMGAGPGQPAMSSKGVETNTLGCGGLCLITDFKGELMPGLAFHGHGTTTWDVVKKKYMGSWTDSMSQGLMIVESTWDPAKKQFAGWMEGPDATGTVVKMRSVVSYADGGRVMTAYGPGPDGKETQIMRITYTRKK